MVLSFLSRPLGVVRTVSGNSGLLRVELAFVGFNVAERVAAAMVPLEWLEPSDGAGEANAPRCRPARR